MTAVRRTDNAATRRRVGVPDRAQTGIGQRLRGRPTDVGLCRANGLRERFACRGATA